MRLTDTLNRGHRPGRPRRGGGRALPVLRRDGDSRTSSTSRTRRRPQRRRRRSSGCTAGPAARRAASTAPRSSSSSTTATSCSGSTTAAAPATARRSTPPTTTSTGTSRSGTASRRRSTCRACRYVDPDRIGIIGGSYGGYMVLAALAFQPDEFEVGVDIFGVSNWVRTLESIPKWWESAAARALQGDRRSRRRTATFLTEISPLFHADKIQQAADRPAGRQRSARHQARVRRHRRRGEEERRAGRVRRLPRRGARLHQEEEPDRGVERDPRRSSTST